MSETSGPPVAERDQDSFAMVLSDILAGLPAHAPTIRDALTSPLSGTTLGLSVGDEHFILGRRGLETSTLDGATVHIIADEPTVLALVQGRTDLVTAARRAEGFDIVGPPGDLAAAEHVLQLLVLGTARDPAAGSIRRRLGALCDESPQEQDAP